jgi:hypothetical protein
MMRAPLILTNCTSRKRLSAEAVTLPADTVAATIDGVARDWLATYSAAPKVRRVRDLYMGRSFSDAYKAARHVEGELFVVSAGLGLVHEDEEAPSYDVTFADATNPLARTLADKGWSSSDWWQALNAVRMGNGPLSRLVVERSPRLVMLALPSGYLEMLVPDLLTLDPGRRELLRIFSSTTGVSTLPAELRRFALPYDDRLESLSGHDGTRTDFPQRAMRHFVEELQGHHVDLEAAKERVADALKGLSPRQTPSRTKRSDSEIADVLRKQWSQYKGSSSQLLRYLRQEAHIACEQKRFRGIWQGLKAEQAAQGARP